MAQAWLKPLWGSLTQVGGGGGGPAPGASGASFIWTTNITEPNSGSFAVVPGIAGDNDDCGIFTAPVDMTLKYVADLTSRGATGYRADFAYYIRINGGSEITLASYLAGEGNQNVYNPGIAISAGDEVELLYTGGNNFSSSASVSFFFEAANTSGGLFYDHFYARFAIGSSNAFLWAGDSGSNVTRVMATEDMIIRSAHFRSSTSTTTDITFTIEVDGVVRWTGVMDGADDNEDWTCDLPVLRGQTYIVRADDDGDGTGYGGMTLACQSAGRPLAPNQSWWMMSSGDSRLASNIGTRYHVPVATTIKEIQVTARFGFNGQIYVSVNGGANIELWNDLAPNSTTTVISTPNLVLGAGDDLVFSHTGTGTTGAGMFIGVLVETAASAVYESPAYVAPVDPIPAGDVLDFNTSNWSSSTSTNKTKGNIYRVVEPRVLTHVRFDSNTAAMTCDVVIALVDDDYVITEIIERVVGVVTGTGWQEVELTTPRLLQPGDNLYVAPVRMDSTAMRMDYDRSPLEADSAGNFVITGTSTIVGDDNAVLDDVYFETTSCWHIGLTTQAAGTRGSHRYWSLLMQGSASGTAHALAGLELRASPGGANLIDIKHRLFSSSADDLQDVANLLDADLATTWEITDADFDAEERRITVCFPNPVAVGEVALSSTSGGDFNKTPTSWKLQFSEDGLLWVDAFTSSGESAWSASETRTYAVGDTVVNTGKDTDHQYWAVLCLDNTNGQSFISVAECEMRETAAGANVATTGFAIDAGNTYTTGNEGDKAFDADGATYWQVQESAARKNTRWFGQNFGSGNEKCIKEITLQARTGSQAAQAPTMGLVMYSDNGTDWSPAWSFANNSTWGAGEVRTFQSPTI